jgi:eukaryotic-like serine/threonine-protein kinase
VFSAGLVIYRMLTGIWPEYPFEWPPPGYYRLRGRVHPDLIAVLRKAIQLDPRKRYRDAEQMLAAYQPAKEKALRLAARKRRERRNAA